MYITLLLIFSVVGITLFIRECHLAMEKLTGVWYKRKSIGFVKPYIMIECKRYKHTYTRQATEKDIEKLKKKFKIETF